MENNKSFINRNWIAILISILVMVGISWLRFALVRNLKVDNTPFPVEWNYPIFVFFSGAILFLAIFYWKWVWNSDGLTQKSYKREAYWIVILASCMLPFLSNDVFVYLGHGYLSNHGIDVFSHTNILKDSIWINYIDAWPDGPFVYGPLNLIPSKIANWIGGENIWLTFASYKILMMLIGFVIIEFFAKIISQPKDLLIAVVAPSFWLHNVGHMHNDMIACLFILISIYFILKNQLYVSAIFIGIALSCKVSVIIYVPFIFSMYFFETKDNRVKKITTLFISAILLAIAILGSYAIFYHGPESLSVPFNYLAKQNAAKSFAEVLGEILNVLSSELSKDRIDSEVALEVVSKEDPKVYYWGIGQIVFNSIGILMMIITTVIFILKTKLKFTKQLTIEYFIKISFIFFFIYLHIFQAWYLILLAPLIVLSNNIRIKKYFMVISAYSGVHTIIYVIARPSILFYLVPILVVINVSLFLWQFKNNFLKVEAPLVSE